MKNAELTWPNGSRIAVAVTVMLESWPDDKAPTYTVSTSALPPGVVNVSGHAWSTFGGRVGVWRIIRVLDRFKVPATFAVNARSAELYPDAVRQILKSGHDICGHNYTQDEVLSALSPDKEKETIHKCLGILKDVGRVAPTGWLSSVSQYTEHTSGFLAAEGLRWQSDVTYTDLPFIENTPTGRIAAVPNTDFTDNRVLRASPNDFFDAYKGTFDYLYRNEPMSMMVVTLHAQFGGRALMTAVFERVLEYISAFPGVWWATHAELGEWAFENADRDFSYQRRFFQDSRA